MALAMLFLFVHRLLWFCLPLIVINFWLLLLPLGNQYFFVEAVANVEIPGPIITFNSLPLALVILNPSNGPSYLPCSAAINNKIFVNQSHFEFYTWFRDDQKILFRRKRNDFYIFPNGTLRLAATENSIGSYRCVANATKFGYGAISSTSFRVDLAVLQRVNVVPDVMAYEGQENPILLLCPIRSVPSANISWYHGNLTLNENLEAQNNSDRGDRSRFFQTSNNSFVILRPKSMYSGRYRCVAENSFATKKQRQFSWNVNILPALRKRLQDDKSTYDASEENSEQLSTQSSLLPPLQNLTQYVLKGNSLTLYCASNAQSIDWFFRPASNGSVMLSPDSLNSVTYTLLKNNSNQYDIRNADSDAHEGYYRCQTYYDAQTYEIIVMSTPVIDPPLKSYETSLAAQVTIVCKAYGHPKPSIRWYRNGAPLVETYTVRVEATNLKIYSFDIEDQGHYQCFARNEAGETESTAFIDLRRKQDLVNMPPPPKNVKCFPVNYETLFVSFDSNPSLYLLSPSFVTEDPFVWNSTLPAKLLSNSGFLISKNLPILKSFVLFMRGMVKTSSWLATETGHKTETYDISLLSEGVKCATQGLKIDAMFFPSGTLIWWSLHSLKSVKYFMIQFWHNDTQTPPPMFADSIVGTNRTIYTYNSRVEIEQNLIKIPVTTKLYTKDEISREKRSIVNVTSDVTANSGNKFHKFESSIKSESTKEAGNEIVEAVRSEQFSNGNEEVDNGEVIASYETITEVFVPGDVTGILVPNAHKLILRVMAITDDNENLDPDYRYVRWETVDRNHSEHDYLFKAVKIESRSVSVAWKPSDINDCLLVCYNRIEMNDITRENHEDSCDELQDFGSQFAVRNLKPLVRYRIRFLRCETQRMLGAITVQTPRDPPGPISNQKINWADGLVLSWDPPINPNGEIRFYNILWTTNNFTHEMNVTADLRSFKFPNITDKDTLNATIKVIGSSGIGAPIFIPNLTQSHSDENSYPPSSSPTLGIGLGILLSILCIIIFIFLFLRQRAKFKTRNQILNSSELNIPPQTSCNIELHEIQTLIPRKLANTSDEKNLENGEDLHNRHQRSPALILSNRNREVHQQNRLLSTSSVSDSNINVNCVGNALVNGEAILYNKPSMKLYTICSSTPKTHSMRELHEHLVQNKSYSPPDVASPVDDVNKNNSWLSNFLVDQIAELPLNNCKENCNCSDCYRLKGGIELPGKILPIKQHSISGILVRKRSKRMDEQKSEKPISMNLLPSDGGINHPNQNATNHCSHTSLRAIIPDSYILDSSKNSTTQIILSSHSNCNTATSSIIKKCSSPSPPSTNNQITTSSSERAFFDDSINSNQNSTSNTLISENVLETLEYINPNTLSPVGKQQKKQLIDSRTNVQNSNVFYKSLYPSDSKAFWTKPIIDPN